MFITTAYAQAAADAAPASPTTQMLMEFAPYALILIVLYLVMFRPQQMAQKQHVVRLNALQIGDEIVTGGGIVAKVKKLIDEAEVLVEVEDGVKLRILRNTIASVREKPDAVAKTGKTKAAEKAA